MYINKNHLQKDDALFFKDEGVVLRDGGIMLRDGGIMLRGGRIMLRGGGIMRRVGGVMLRVGGVMLRDDGVMRRDDGVLIKSDAYSYTKDVILKNMAFKSQKKNWHFMNPGIVCGVIPFFLPSGRNVGQESGCSIINSSNIF